MLVPPAALSLADCTCPLALPLDWSIAGGGLGRTLRSLLSGCRGSSFHSQDMHSQLRVPLLSWGHLATSRNDFGCHGLDTGMQWVETRDAAKSCRAQGSPSSERNVTSAQVEKLPAVPTGKREDDCLPSSFLKSKVNQPCAFILEAIKVLAEAAVPM